MRTASSMQPASLDYRSVKLAASLGTAPTDTRQTEHGPSPAEWGRAHRSRSPRDDGTRLAFAPPRKVGGEDGSRCGGAARSSSASTRVGAVASMVAAGGTRRAASRPLAWPATVTRWWGATPPAPVSSSQPEPSVTRPNRGSHATSQVRRERQAPRRRLRSFVAGWGGVSSHGIPWEALDGILKQVALCVTVAARFARNGANV